MRFSCSQFPVHSTEVRSAHLRKLASHGGISLRPGCSFVLRSRPGGDRADFLSRQAPRDRRAPHRDRRDPVHRHRPVQLGTEPRNRLPRVVARQLRRGAHRLAPYPRLRKSPSKTVRRMCSITFALEPFRWAVFIFSILKARLVLGTTSYKFFRTRGDRVIC